MSEEHAGERRRRLIDFAARAVTLAKTATSATSATAARAVASANTAAAKAAAAASSVTARASVPPDSGVPEDGEDGTIARLEQELDAERTKTAELEAALKALEFKLNVLERSYGKQLADSRAANDATKQELAEVQARLAETAHELKQVTAVRDRLRDMFAFDGRRVPPELRERQAGIEDTIARLMSMPGTPPERDEDPGGRPHPETPELLSPDLVFDPNEDGDNEDDDRGAA